MGFICLFVWDAALLVSAAAEPSTQTVRSARTSDGGGRGRIGNNRLRKITCDQIGAGEGRIVLRNQVA